MEQKGSLIRVLTGAIVMRVGKVGSWPMDCCMKWAGGRGLSVVSAVPKP